jgi:L-ascorbate metabolism protein UlaG (beta-lactamase superfamily)
LQPGEAIVWYLSHAGWAVKTADHFLIFDYWEQDEPSSPRTLADGYVDPQEIADQHVAVLVSHGHGDHFDPVIYSWRDAIADLHYVFGWAATTDAEFTYLTAPRADIEIDGVRIRTVNHEFDRIPEVAFLVEVDGITLFHSGDHGSTRDELNPVFQDNIDYLASLDLDVDLAFLSIFGRRGGGIVNRGDVYTIEQLTPRITFPMHRGGAEEAYETWARAIADTDLETDVQFATRPGDVFLYRNGGVSKSR